MGEFKNLVGIAADQHGYGKSNFDSWKSAIGLTKRSRQRYPISELNPLLQALGAWSLSTSGVEQNFSINKWLLAKRPLSIQHQADHLLIAVAEASASVGDRLFKEAACLWTALYGRPRRSTRRLRGYKKQKKPQSTGQPPSLQHCLQVRRSAARALQKRQGAKRKAEEIVDEAEEVAGDQWTGKHTADKERQEAILQERRLDAFERNYLLDKEADGLEEAAALRKSKEEARKKKRTNDERLWREKMTRPSFNLFGHCVWVQGACGLTQTRIKEILLEHHMRTTSSQVDLYVVEDVASPPAEIHLLAAMSGSMLGSPHFFESGGQVGCCIGFEPAIRTARKVYISEEFAANHRQCSAALLFMMRGSGKWERLPSLSSWLRVQLARNSNKAWALLSEREKQQHHALKEHDYAMTLRDFLNHISTVDRSRTALGIGLST